MSRQGLMRERHSQMLLNIKFRPIWQLRAVRDGRDPPDCPGLTYPVYRWDDVFWKKNGPWVCERVGCRCSVRPYAPDEEPMKL